MGKNTGIASIGLSLAAICISFIALITSFMRGGSTNEVITGHQEEPTVSDIQYVLYLGTNDKDTNEPVFAPDEAKAKAEEILLGHFGGYTIQDANGGWVDGEKVYREYTLVIYLSDTDIEQVHAAADEMIEAFHQSSVLIQENETRTDFYSGND